MSEFRIEKTRRRVTIAMRDGATLEGDVFLQPIARYRLGPQLPIELLNEPDPFIPLAVSDSDLVLVSKEQILRVQYSVDAADTEDDGVDASVDVVFADGSTVSGQLRLETRAERPRLLDFLNDGQQGFLLLRSPDETVLINRRAIARVRQRR